MRISSQYVFDYQKRILFPAQYMLTKFGKAIVKLPEIVGKGYGTFWRYKGRYRVVKGPVQARSQRQLPCGTSPT